MIKINFIIRTNIFYFSNEEIKRRSELDSKPLLPELLGYPNCLVSRPIRMDDSTIINARITKPVEMTGIKFCAFVITKAM